MKISMRVIFALILALLLDGCGKTIPISENEKLLAVVYMEVFLSATAQVNPSTGLDNAISTFSPTFAASPTLGQVTPELATLTPTPLAVVGNCYASTFIRDVTIPDGAILAPGDEFNKTWKFLNSGTCGWKSNTMLSFLGGDGMDGNNTAVGEFVAPGATGKITVSMIAPDEEGIYTGYWILRDPNGTPFGAEVYVTIIVSADTSSTDSED
jgi:hypothetical protein